jgi:serine/threonine protein kinase
LKKVLNAQNNSIWIPKIADFGMARKFENHAMFTVSAAVGTEIYNAPELWRFTGGVAEELISYNSDIWTLGIAIIILYFIIDNCIGV